MNSDLPARSVVRGIRRQRSCPVTPGKYARELLAELGQDTSRLSVPDARPDAVLWAESGAQYLTGEADGPPLSSPAPLAAAARGAWLALAALSEGALSPDFPAHQLLGERAAILGLQRRGAVSPGGACHLLRCADGLIALNLTREDDWRLLPAWLECAVEGLDAVAALLGNRPCEPLVARARPDHGGRWYHTTRCSGPAGTPHRSALVVDLSTIWAGPLCTGLLADMGARVIKVESTSRPDGTRRGDKAFFDLLNAGKESVALDLDTERGRDQLRHLLHCADIVVESARPRGLEQMGIRAMDIVTAGTGITWLSITGHGRTSPRGHWVSYGDDAGVAAGLSALLQETSDRAVFCGDAIADPLTGLHAALLAWHSWRQGGGVLLDVPLVGVLARCITASSQGQPAGVPVTTIKPPVARRPTGHAPALGHDTGAVLSDLGIRA
jgi:crotonobetainyl-CoA:carnitine CoA-transferase CaiB-like acyl-CoA transferase